jgi:long-chain acyl-CoA synthetase
VTKEALGIRPGVRSLLSAPLYHSAPSSFAQQSLLQGSLFVLEEKFDAEATLALIERHRIETAYLVPVMYVRLLSAAGPTCARAMTCHP